MNLDQLRGFVAVAELGRFTQAAGRLHLAQPTLSRQIATLERTLQVRLFDRSPGQVRLTPAGQTLLPVAQRMLADADLARRELDELSGLRRGQVRLGATPTLCISLVAQVLTAFHEAHPGIELHVHERGSRGLIEDLERGGSDLALITTSLGSPSATLAAVPLLSEELVVIGPPEPGSPLTGRPVLTLAELARLPQITFHRSYDLRTATDAAYQGAGLSPSVVIEGAEMDAVLRFVECGLGVALVPAMVLGDRSDLSTARLRSPAMHRTVSLARRRDGTPTRAAAAMEEVIMATVRDLATGPASELVQVPRARD